MTAIQLTSYSRLQVLLHWGIGALILFQIVFGEAMEEMAEAKYAGNSISSADEIMGNAHIWIGITILALSALRLLLRSIRKAPVSLPAPAVQHKIASTIHTLFYVLMFAVPLSGMAAWFGGIGPAAGLHSLSKPFFILLITLHVAGTLWHQFAMKDNIIKRMW